MKTFMDDIKEGKNIATDAHTDAATAQSEVDALETVVGAAQGEIDALEGVVDARVKIAVVSLAGGAANAFAFAWQNPETVAILVQRVLVDRDTAGGTATAVIDIGTAADATTGSNNLIDGLDANATGLADNISDAGSSGKARQKLDAKDGGTDYITGQILVEAAASLAGKVYIEYVKVQ